MVHPQIELKAIRATNEEMDMIGHNYETTDRYAVLIIALPREFFECVEHIRGVQDMGTIVCAGGDEIQGGVV